MPNPASTDPRDGGGRAASPRSKVLFDTSVLVAALVKGHPDHDRASVPVRSAAAGKTEGCVATHGLAELYAVLTVLPVRPRITPGHAHTLIRHNVTSHMTLIALGASDYEAVIERMMRLGLAGGVVYDALHLRAAEKAGVDQLLTFNRRNFERLRIDTRIELDFL